MRPKCIIVVGPAGSGSILISQIIAHALDICKFDKWPGIGWAERKNCPHKVYHGSMPSGGGNPKTDTWPDIKTLINNHKKEYEIYIVLTVRDRSIMEVTGRYTAPTEYRLRNLSKARETIEAVINSKIPYKIWSYETFMYLENLYLKEMWKFLGIQSDFVPEIKDANPKYLFKHLDVHPTKGWIKWSKK